MSHQPGIDKINLYTNNPNEPKYQFLIKKRKSVGKKHLTFIALIETLNDMKNVYKSSEEYNPGK